MTNLLKRKGSLKICGGRFLLNLSRNRLTAFLRPANKETSFEDIDWRLILQEAEHHGIVFGLLPKFPGFIKGITIVARGVPPVHGEDAIISLSTKTFGKGKTDSQEAENVLLGQRLLLKTPPTPGTVGKNVLGKEVKARNGTDTTIPGGPGTFLSEDGCQLLAAYDGRLIIKNGIPSVVKAHTCNFANEQNKTANTGAELNNSCFTNDMPIPKRSWKERVLAVCIIIVVLAGSGMTGLHLMKTTPKAQVRPPQKIKILATAIDVKPTSINAEISALGKVIPAQEVQLQSRVSGTVVHINPQFLPGGIIRNDEVVVRLDDTDYKLALTQKQDSLIQFTSDLHIEEGNQNIALHEWQLFNEKVHDFDSSSQDLALRKPQLVKVMSSIKKAEAEVEHALLDISRTVIRAPFNSMVYKKNIDLGSQVSSQTILATLTGVDIFWAEILIPADKLEWIVFPDNDQPGSKIIVYVNNDMQFAGHIVKLLPEIEQDGLMARLLIGIQDPLGFESGKPPLLLGSFIKADIVGKSLVDVFRIPRSALKNDNSVFLVTQNNTLHIQPVSIKWRTTDSVFIDDGLTEGDRIIISNVKTAIEGMEIELTGKGPE